MTPNKKNPLRRVFLQAELGALTQWLGQPAQKQGLKGKTDQGKSGCVVFIHF